MRALIVDDDIYSRSMLHELLHPHAYCDIAVNGEEAVFAFRKAWQEGKPYDLICMDIVMPDMDGHLALREIRAIESEMGVESGKGVKVLMTSVLDDNEETHDAFYLGGADGYIVKPVSDDPLLVELRRLGLIA